MIRPSLMNLLEDHLEEIMNRLDKSSAQDRNPYESVIDGFVNAFLNSTLSIWDGVGVEPQGTYAEAADQKAMREQGMWSMEANDAMTEIGMDELFAHYGDSWRESGPSFGGFTSPSPSRLPLAEDSFDFASGIRMTSSPSKFNAKRDHSPSKIASSHLASLDSSKAENPVDLGEESMYLPEPSDSSRSLSSANTSFIQLPHSFSSDAEAGRDFIPGVMLDPHGRLTLIKGVIGRPDFTVVVWKKMADTAFILVEDKIQKKADAVRQIKRYMGDYLQVERPILGMVYVLTPTGKDQGLSVALFRQVKDSKEIRSLGPQGLADNEKDVIWFKPLDPFVCEQVKKALKEAISS
ncbi:hypothetical protein VKT23_019426 [Stygiomarasmius scandens]|uniref:Uncharacterized protein n=1 Tax=Marasmiellus scandens TaxID=2682957 RepID=A0ABR1IPH1_9AGAR